eukprot:469618_1
MTNLNPIFSDNEIKPKLPLRLWHIPKTGGTSIEQAAWKEDIKWGEVLMTQCPKYSNGTNQFYLLSERICAQSNICVNENEGYWHLPLKHCISYFENNNDSTV